MPLYEYRCRKCGIQVEKIQKFSDSPLETCAACGGQLERLLSTPALRFKGSGWDVTNYARKSSPTEGANSESSATGKTDGSSGGEAKKAAESPKPPSGSKSSSE